MCKPLAWLACSAVPCTRVGGMGSFGSCAHSPTKDRTGSRSGTSPIRIEHPRTDRPGDRGRHLRLGPPPAPRARPGHPGRAAPSATSSPAWSRRSGPRRQGSSAATGWCVPVQHLLRRLLLLPARADLELREHQPCHRRGDRRLRLLAHHGRLRRRPGRVRPRAVLGRGRREDPRRHGRRHVLFLSDVFPTGYQAPRWARSRAARRWWSSAPGRWASSRMKSALADGRRPGHRRGPRRLPARVRAAATRAWRRSTSGRRRRHHDQGHDRRPRRRRLHRRGGLRGRGLGGRSGRWRLREAAGRLDGGHQLGIHSDAQGRQRLDHRRVRPAVEPGRHRHRHEQGAHDAHGPVQREALHAAPARAHPRPAAIDAEGDLHPPVPARAGAARATTRSRRSGTAASRSRSSRTEPCCTEEPAHGTHLERPPPDRQSGRQQGHAPVEAVDLDPRQRPGVPAERPPQPWPNSRFPPNACAPQPSAPKHGRPNKSMPPVYGTAVPLHGLSGVIRKAAYSYPDHVATHWLLLLLGDRVDSWGMRTARISRLARPSRSSPCSGTACSADRTAGEYSVTPSAARGRPRRGRSSPAPAPTV